MERPGTVEGLLRGLSSERDQGWRGLAEALRARGMQTAFLSPARLCGLRWGGAAGLMLELLRGLLYLGAVFTARPASGERRGWIIAGGGGALSVGVACRARLAAEARRPPEGGWSVTSSDDARLRALLAAPAGASIAHALDASPGSRLRIWRGYLSFTAPRPALAPETVALLAALPGALGALAGSLEEALPLNRSPLYVDPIRPLSWGVAALNRALWALLITGRWALMIVAVWAISMLGLGAVTFGAVALLQALGAV